MQTWAAIDVLEGAVVTLLQGKPSEKTVWREDPISYAARWQDEGAYGLHLIDLDAAFQRGSNRETILGIVRRAYVPVQVGGGIRDRESARAWLDSGADRIVLGTMVYKNRDLFLELLRDYGRERIVVATDYRDGAITTEGWTERSGTGILQAVEELETLGVSNILATSVGKDGTGSGPDLETITRIRRATKMSLLASGGIRDAQDLENLERAGADGAVLGRALYEEKIRTSDVGGPKR